MKDREVKAKNPWMKYFTLTKKSTETELYKGEVYSTLSTTKLRSNKKSIKEGQ